MLAKRLDEAGLSPVALPRNGLVVDIGSGDGPVVALRADLDALPVDDRTDDPWASTVQGVAHACGHDVHAAALLGAGLSLAAVADSLPGRVRLIFQPAEEIMPGGALMAIEAGALDGVSHIFGLHADPGLDVGTVGLREGPLTGAADHLDVLLSGKGGHTSRPHLTSDLTFALGKLVTELPAVLSRRLDPRAGRQRRLGHRPVRLRGQRDPLGGSRRRHRADARRRRLGRRRGAGPRHDRADRRAVRRGARRSPTSAASRRSSTSTARPMLLGKAVQQRARRGGARRDQPEPRRRGLRVVPRQRPRRDGPAGHPLRRVARRTTSTRATCAWTSGPSRSAPRCWPRPRSTAMVTDR